jgi:hypothetical protein
MLLASRPVDCPTGAEAVRIGLRLATQAVKRGRGVLGALEWFPSFTSP